MPPREGWTATGLERRGVAFHLGSSSAVPPPWVANMQHCLPE
jgi:hypothetical protein